MTMSPPPISVIMPCLDCARHMPSSVGSLLAQTYPDFELLIVDDGSTDNSAGIANGFGDDRIRVLRQSNSGVSSARNLGLSQARGEYVAFLDADDTWAPDFLEHMSQALDNAPDAVLAYCGWQNVGLPGPSGMPYVPPDYETPQKARTIFTSCPWPIHAALVRRSAAMAAGGFDVNLKNAEDFALWLKLAIPARVVRVPEVLAYYHFHGSGQASGNRARAALQHWHAQMGYLHENPGFLSLLGRQQARQITLGELLKRGYACYWERDLTAARQIFRVVLTHGYGTFRDWKYMLPSLLPLSLHRFMVSLLGKEKTVHVPLKK